MVVLIIILIIFSMAVIASVVTIGGSKNEHEKKISDRAQMDFCGEIYKESLKKDRK